MAILWPNGLTTPPAVSSGFGPRGSGAYGDASTYHRGTDFVGFDVVHSIADGTVVYVGWNGGVGWSSVAGFMVWVQHDGFFSRYLHTAAGTERVSVGDRVTAGQALVDMGYSGLFDNAGNPAPWRKHTHVEIAPGTWNRSNVGQVDPYAWLSERVTASSSGAGGSAVAPVIESEEDDVKLYRVTPNGRHYAVAPGFIKQITGKESVQAYEKAAGVKEIEVDGATFTVILGVNGISTAGSASVLDGSGRVLDDRTGQGAYVHGGSWGRGDKAERLAYLAQKG